MGTFFDQIEDALSGSANNENNRFLNSSGDPQRTSFPQQSTQPAFKARTSSARRTQQGDKAPTRKTVILQGEPGTENPEMLRPSEKQQRQPQAQGKTVAQKSSGEGIKPLQDELKDRSKQDLEKTLKVLQEQAGQKKVFGSNLTVAQAKKVVQDEIKQRR